MASFADFFIPQMFTHSRTVSMRPTTKERDKINSVESLSRYFVLFCKIDIKLLIQISFHC